MAIAAFEVVLLAAGLTALGALDTGAALEEAEEDHCAHELLETAAGEVVVVLAELDELVVAAHVPH